MIGECWCWIWSSQLMSIWSPDGAEGATLVFEILVLLPEAVHKVQISSMFWHILSKIYEVPTINVLGRPKNRIIFQHILQLKQIYGWFPHDLCPKIWFSVAFSHEHDDFPIFVYSSPKKPTDFFSGIPTIASWRPSRLRLGEPPQGRCQAGCLTAGYWGLLQLDISKLSGGRTMPWIVTNSDYNIIVVI